MPSLQNLVAAEHQTWDDPVVEKAIFGFSDPELVANAFSSYCANVLGSPIANAFFYRVSVACVAGVHLADGRQAVIKAQNGGRRADYLAACIDYRKQLAQTGFPCPTPLAPPEKLNGAWFTSEELLTRGSPADAHDLPIRRSIVSALAQLETFSTHFPTPNALAERGLQVCPRTAFFPSLTPLFSTLKPQPKALNG
ncbi:MAG: hypothetical protein IPK82_16095 [Polyangiaceae bacterium]|nr:hypothetical protein [Polyangiaceae bacterium]